MVEAAKDVAAVSQEDRHLGGQQPTESVPVVSSQEKPLNGFDLRTSEKFPSFVPCGEKKKRPETINSFKDRKLQDMKKGKTCNGSGHTTTDKKNRDG